MASTDPTPPEFDPFVDEPSFVPAAREARKEAALELLAEGCDLSETAAALGVHRHTLRRWRQGDPEFARRCVEAAKVHVDALKAEAERRALRGSDKLLMFLLCNYAPDQFSMQSKLEVSAGAGLADAILAARQRAKGDCPLA